MIGTGWKTCERCGRVSAVLTCGVCPRCFEDELQRFKSEQGNAVAGGQGRAASAVVSAALFLAWALTACSVVVAVWVVARSCWHAFVE